MDLERQLFEDYLCYWRRTGAVMKVQTRIGPRKTMRPPEYTRERQGALRDMALFCVDHGADPRVWLYTLFVARRWVYAPTWRQLCPKSHVKRYHKEHRLGFFQARLSAERQKRRRAKGVDFDPNVDIAPHVEAVKGELVRTGQQALCIARMQTETLGYHPRSAVCGACNAQAACIATLRRSVPFDIIALRLDVITAEQAQAHHRASVESRLSTAELIYGSRNH